jgi:hypothetical protein
VLNPCGFSSILLSTLEQSFVLITLMRGRRIVFRESFAAGVGMERRSAIFLLVFSLVWSAIGSGGDAYHLAFHPRDILPLLPGSIAMPVLKSLHGAVDLLPQFVGAVSSGNESVVWNGTCFYQNVAYMEYVEPEEEGRKGGGVLHIQVCCSSLPYRARTRC